MSDQGFDKTTETVKRQLTSSRSSPERLKDSASRKSDTESFTDSLDSAKRGSGSNHVREVGKDDTCGVEREWISQTQEPKDNREPIDGAFEHHYIEVVDAFDDMSLREDLLRGIYAYGFEKPSAIQQKAILPCIKGCDVIAQAQSGTGKTATFAIAILEKLDLNNRQTQALVLAPTRELAHQIWRVIMTLGDYMNVKCHACVGGTGVRKDIRTLEEGAPIVVGTPGRVFEMMNRGFLISSSIKMLVLDEADEMLSLGFKEQIFDIFQLMPNDAQVRN
ncbi:ATP-dependent RNA helicase eIF4A [Elysia marginata]|uniref:ATP-dependent RNA helicase n=1 Tax=Elysia marginata TaxID=1093978 RepID=A0AAV4K062_9GAST|nr:ATP-dependent RNA helicase eIF4A [Elysia marginata]